MFCYVITNSVNGKQYVGMTKNTPEGRFRGHCLQASKGGKGALYNAIRKYGIENFSVERVGEAHSREQLQELEKQEIIKRRTRYPNGYNLTDGGDGRLIPHSEEARAKMRIAMRRYYSNVDPEALLERGRKIAAAVKGKKRGFSEKRNLVNVGRVRSEEFKAKVSDGMKKMIASLPAGEMGRRSNCRAKGPKGPMALTPEQRAAWSERTRAGALKRYQDPEQRRLTAERTRAQHARRRAVAEEKK